MKPKRSKNETQSDLFTAQLSEVINLDHPLVKLSKTINWTTLEETFEKFYCQNNGRVGISTRLMISLHYLKFTHNLSDEGVLQGWIENPYWQYFSGYDTFQFSLPIDSSSMTRWRNRVTDEGAKSLLDETISAGLKLEVITKKELKHVNVDTTVQEKYIRFPTDARLYARAIEKLVKGAKRCGINLRQSYSKVVPKLLYQYSNLSHRRKYKEARKKVKKLKTILGRIIRELERNESLLDEKLSFLLQIAKKIYTQQKTSKNKVYSVHEPDVHCISNGKQHKKYEFGNKVGFSVTSKGNWILSAASSSESVHDSKTLNQTVDNIPEAVDKLIKNIYVDKGYRGSKLNSNKTLFIDTNKKREYSKAVWKWMKGRAGIEPTIGHLKEEHRMNKCRLKSIIGDSVNEMLSAAAYNFKKLLKLFASLLNMIIFCIKILLNQKNQPKSKILTIQ